MQRKCSNLVSLIAETDPHHVKQLLCSSKRFQTSSLKRGCQKETIKCIDASRMESLS